MYIVGLTAWLVMSGYVALFLALTRRASRSSGTSIWLFAAGRERQAIAALLFRLAFSLGVVFPPLLELLSSSGNSLAFLLDPPLALKVIGVTMMVLGAAWALHAQAYMGASWRIGAAEGRLGTIVDTGPFGMSRNPVFVGQAILFAGSLVVFPNPVQALIVGGLLIAIVLQVRIEERVLMKELGEVYAAYTKRVPRWL